MKPVTDRTWNVLPGRMRFTVLQRDPHELLPTLIYWNDHKTFRHEVDFSEPIKGIEIEGRQAAFYFRNELLGYELGLEVPTHWWERMCMTGELKELAKTKSDTDYLTETTRLRIAILPYAEFAPYYHKPRKEPPTDVWPFLPYYGWKRGDDPWGYYGHGDGPWDYVEHKYFAILHRSL